MTSKRMVLHFPGRLVEQPIVFKLVKDFNLSFNILKARVTPEEEGLMVLELSGSEEDFNRGIEYLKSSGLRLQLLSEDVVRDPSKCTDCGLCVPICPAKALEVDSKSRKVVFHEDKCIACEMCVRICPSHAMKIDFTA
ncbi:MAG: NIL domain-containing protein [Deltaproteobacteria bacterium]